MNKPLATSAVNSPGTLYLVATPIGNREDISARAIRVLESVDAILAEDTRHSLPLLGMLGIQKPLHPLHAHNENLRSPQWIDDLLQGKHLALISDAGTPLICDPGFPLVRLARENGIPVVPIPGPCALIAALSASGLPAEPFTFCGFLPARAAARKQTLASVKPLGHTLVWYESPHRLTASLQDIRDVFGEESTLVLAKELTKSFESFIQGSATEILAWLDADKARLRGEFVIMLSPGKAPSQTPDTLTPMLEILLRELPLKQAVKIAASLTGVSRNTVYDRAVILQRDLS